MSAPRSTMRRVGDRIDFPAAGKSSKRGGKRPGAGRPPGSKNVLPAGCVAAIKACGLRVPSDASPAQRALADRALQRVADVMEDKVSSFTAFAVLTAARAIREEVCGPVTKKVEHSGSITFRIEDDE